jgi:hypothetical protein
VSPTSRNNALGWILAAAGLGAAGFGVWRGEGREVLLKAVNICLECIGLR